MSDFWFIPSTSSKSEHLQKKGGEHFFAGQRKPQPFFNPGVQTKLTINSPGDPYEKEADAMADLAVEAKKTDSQTSGPSPFTKVNPLPFVQRECSECDGEEKLQKKE